MLGGHDTVFNNLEN